MEVETKTPVSDKIGLVGSLIASVMIFLLAIYSFIIDLFVDFNLYGIIIDFIFLFIAFEVGFFAMRTFGRLIYYEKIVDASFEKGIYKRLEPLLRKIAEVGVEIDEMREEVDLVNRKVATIIAEQAKVSPEMIAPGASMKFAVKTILLTVLTMAGFLYMLQYPIGVVHYATLGFYILWWLFLTGEFELFEEMGAWLFVSVPILIIPIGAIIFHALFGLNAMIGIFYGGLALFIVIYYSWAMYTKRGVLPFSIPAFNLPKTKRKEFRSQDRLAPLNSTLKEKKILFIRGADALILLLTFVLLGILIYLFI
ncbi:hypothetical protein DRN98_07275 [Methanosarcinales archaeon]|nr:MAG: hypothetical protein DRN98_07275 [Methanosarcinales archaeon]